MKRLNSSIIITVLFAVVMPAVFAGGGVSLPPEKGKETFYTRPPMFSTRPSSITKFVQYVERFGPVGIGIELHPPAFVMKVKNVEEGSPAEKTGQLKPGMIIETINGEKLHDIDPRIQLGNIITKAEATDGKVVLAVKEDAESPVKNVTVNIPVLGAYSETWPLNCEKSEKIVRQLAENFAKQEWSGKIELSGPKMLFMLSTGEDKDLEVVKGWIKKTVEKNQNFGDNGFCYQWFISWGGPCLAEYYLRTGDESILPIMKKMADAVRKTMYHDAWGGRGVAAHHMGHAGTGTLTFLLLARQCGVEVEEGMLQTALQHFYRFSGKGVNPYMDAYPEGGTTDNGRNARLAFAMAAASALDPKGEDSLYAKARDIAAMHSFYSGSYMNHGHTGGGIGEVWRSAAMGLLYEKTPKQYREFMNNRSWWLDISRRYNGNFGILGGTSYDKESWGITMGLTYTLPRKKLCIFGAPRSPYTKPHKIPARAWGNAADDQFLSMKAAADKNGKVADLSGETFANDSGLAMTRRLSVSDMSDKDVLFFARHLKHALRQGAAGRIYHDKRFHLILDLLKDKDARVRYAGLSAMPLPRVSSRPEKCDPGFPQEKVTDEILARLFEMLNDPDESWYVVDKVLQCLSRRSAEELAPHIDRISSFLGHKEWWLRHSALRAMVPLALYKPTYKKAMFAMIRDVPSFIRSPRSLADFAKGLANADPEIQKAGVETLGKIYQLYPGRSANPPGGLHPSGNSEKNYLNTVAQALQGTPGGLDVLYTVSKERYPNKVLPYNDLFLRAKNVDDSPRIKEALNHIIMEQLIPEFVGRNLPNIEKAAKGGSVGGYRDLLDQLGSMYAKAGKDDYGWTAFGTDRHDNEWEYFCFDPPEKVKLVNERKNRYRKVTYPKGMENWYAKDFDAKAAGWKTGKAPISNFDNKITAGNPESGCAKEDSHCGCADPGKTLWDKEVILMRRTFELPPLEKGYRYRLLFGGASHVGTGDGYCIYINGKKITEEKGYGGRGSGGLPDGIGIAPEFFEEFKDGKVVVATTSFLRQHQRSHKIHGHMNLWFQKQKIPPFGDDLYKKSIPLIPMACSAWQDLQDPAKTNTDPNEGKYKYSRELKANDAALGDWVRIGEVASVDDFKGGDKLPPFKAPQIARHAPKGATFKSISLKPDGKTDSPERLWTGDTLINLKRDYRGSAAFEALKMVPKTIDGKEYLLIESGGFTNKHPADWKCYWIVFKKK